MRSARVFASGSPRAGVIRDAIGGEGVRPQDGFGIAGASEFDPCASFAMNGRFVT